MLSEKIINLRKSRGWSQEELAERLNVSRQSVSKWESDISTPELDKIVAMSTLFGVSTDYLLKDATANESEPIRDFVREDDEDEEEREDKNFSEEPLPTREVSAAEAEEYLAAIQKAGPRIALGVLLCILSPLALILLGILSDIGVLAGEEIVAACGLFALFAFVGAAIAIFIPTGMSLSKYDYLEKHILVLPEAFEKNLTENYEANNRKQLMRITCGVLLCVLGALTLILAASLFPEWEWIIMISLAPLFLFCAVGVYIIVRTCYLRGAYQRLLQIEDYSIGDKKKIVRRTIMENIYWPIVLALYLSISFLTHRWDITWLVWLIAAILSTPVETLLGKKKK